MSRRTEKTEYRRGILLGLTMAEIFIVILFLLLLSFISMFEVREQELATLKDKYDALVGKSSDNRVEKIKTIVMGSSPDMADDLINVLEMVPKWIERINLNQLKRDDAETPQQTISRILEQAKPPETNPASCETKLTDTQVALQTLEAETDVLRAQQKNYLTQVENKSLALPPCWPEPDGSWGDSIFKVDLNDKGMVIFDNAPPNRAEAKASLPLDTVKYGVVNSPSAFMTQTTPLYQWSRKNHCDFLVQVADKTGDKEKIHYKRLYNTVKGHFIIQDIKGSYSLQKKDEPETKEKNGSFFKNFFKPKKDKSNKDLYN